MCDHRTHPNAQINLNKRDLLLLALALRPRQLLKYRLDHPAQRAHRGREHSDDGPAGCGAMPGSSRGGSDRCRVRAVARVGRWACGTIGGGL
jgi:hypothetical protein